MKGLAVHWRQPQETGRGVSDKTNSQLGLFVFPSFNPFAFVTRGVMLLASVPSVAVSMSCRASSVYRTDLFSLLA